MKSFSSAPCGIFLTLVLLFPCSLQAQSVEEGVQMMKRGNLAAAKQTFESIIDRDDKNAEAHFRLGQVYMTKAFEDPDNAVDHIERATEINPARADYAFAMGQAYGLKTMRAGVLKKAFLAPKVKTWFEKTVELEPRHLGGHVGLAQYLSQAPGIMGGDMEKAWKETEIVRQLDPFQGTVLKAQLLEREKKYVEAEQEMKSFVTSRPKEWRVWKNLGYFFIRRSDYGKAIEAFNKYTEIRPDTADSFDSLGEAQLKKGAYDHAEVSFKKALALDKNCLTSIEQLGQVYEAKGMKKQARETYQWYCSVQQDEAKRKKVQEKINDLQ